MVRRSIAFALVVPLLGCGAALAVRGQHPSGAYRGVVASAFDSASAACLGARMLATNCRPPPDGGRWVHVESRGTESPCGVTDRGHAYCEYEEFAVAGARQISSMGWRRGKLEVCVLGRSGVQCTTTTGELRRVRGTRTAVLLEGRCALLRSGAVVCWQRHARAAVPVRLRPAVDIATDADSGVLCVADGPGRRVHCLDDESRWRPVASTRDAIDVTTTVAFVCARWADGRVACWRMPTAKRSPIQRPFEGLRAVGIDRYGAAICVTPGSGHPICVRDPAGPLLSTANKAAHANAE